MVRVWARLRWPALLAVAVAVTLGCGDDFTVMGLPGSADGIRCSVTGDALAADNLFVTARDGTSFFANVRDVPARVRIPEVGEPTAPALVRVGGVIVFSAWTAEPNYYLAADVETELVGVRVGAKLAWAHTSAGAVVGMVTTGHRYSGSRVGPVTVPCDALSLDSMDDWLLDDWVSPAPGDGTTWVLRNSLMADGAVAASYRGEADEYEYDAYQDEDDGGLPWGNRWLNDNELDEVSSDQWAADSFEGMLADAEPRPLRGAERVHLWPHPARGAGIDVEASNLMFERVEVAGDWMKVQESLGVGVVSGWIPRAELVQFNGGAVFSAWGSGSYSMCCGRPGTSNEATYEGPATVAWDSPLFARAHSGSQWATVRSGEPLTVHHVLGEDWVRLVDMPGLFVGCGGGGRTWLSRDAVSLPGADAYRSKL